MDTELVQGTAILAAPWVEKNYFCRSVVYITAHDPVFTMGLVLNRRASWELNEMVEGAPEGIPIYIGGPLGQDKLFIVHNKCLNMSFPQQVHDNVFWNSTKTVDIKEMFYERGVLPHNVKIFWGFCGWGSKILKEEMETGAWLYEKEFINPLEPYTKDMYSRMLCGQGVEDILIPPPYAENLQ